MLPDGQYIIVEPAPRVYRPKTEPAQQLTSAQRAEINRRVRLDIARNKLRNAAAGVDRAIGRGRALEAARPGGTAAWRAWLRANS